MCSPHLHPCAGCESMWDHAANNIYISIFSSIATRENPDQNLTDHFTCVHWIQYINCYRSPDELNTFERRCADDDCHNWWHICLDLVSREKKNWFSKFDLPHGVNISQSMHNFVIRLNCRRSAAAKNQSIHNGIECWSFEIVRLFFFFASLILA